MQTAITGRLRFPILSDRWEVIMHVFHLVRERVSAREEKWDAWGGGVWFRVKKEKPCSQ